VVVAEGAMAALAGLVDRPQLSTTVGSWRRRWRAARAAARWQDRQ